MQVAEAVDFMLNVKSKDIDGGIGLRAVDPKGEIALRFNSDRMHRGCKTSDAEGLPEIY
jgi:L-asparaginase / beta-aspartyl-peptidase